ncbi:MAG: flavodoxin domain-containing protein [Candidatus Promineifilaceae bacterium]|nr:flavodoxin domain-containing protein [Candidatus Promineifilaceae bacterium]
MNITIVYDSSTGTTAKAAEAMGKTMEAHGHQCRVQSVAQADPAEVSEADLICLGSWVKGLFIVRQHPTEGTMQFIEQLGDLSGKKAIVFCTYKLAIGSTLRQMAQALEKKGATVVEQFKYRGPEPPNKFALFAKSLT